MKDDCYYDKFNIFGESYSLPLVEGESHTKEKILLVATMFFAKRGFASVSLKDIAKVVGIRPASLYYHFESKEALWREVLTHAKELYILYFKRLEATLEKADSFDAVLEALFHEPKRLANVFTCYAFSMVQVEQFNDEYAGEIFNDTFLKYSIEFIQEWLEKSIERGYVARFDTRAVASIVIHSILVGLEVNIHKDLGRIPAYDPSAMFAQLQRFILSATGAAAIIEKPESSAPSRPE